MERKAVIIDCGTKYCICCDIGFLPEFFQYVMADASAVKEIKTIFGQIKEGLKSKKYSNEDEGCTAMKPFKNRQNDRIICQRHKIPGNKQYIIMSEIFMGKKTNANDKKIKTRYKAVSKIKYEIVK